MPKVKKVDKDAGLPVRGYKYKAPEDPQREELYEIVSQLSPFEQRFVECYPKAASAAEAARLAGSMSKRPEQVANNTLRKPAVMRAIAMMRARRIDAAALDEIEVVTKFREVFAKALEKGDFKEANRSAELLGAHLGMFRGHGKSRGGGIYHKGSSPMHGLSDEGAQLQSEADRGGLSNLLQNPNTREDLAAMAEIIIRTNTHLQKPMITQDNRDDLSVTSHENTSRKGSSLDVGEMRSVTKLSSSIRDIEDIEEIPPEGLPKSALHSETHS